MLDNILAATEATQNDQDMEFAETIMSILRTTFIALDGDLPDDMALKSRCVDGYNAFYPTTTPAELEQFERQQYDQAINGTKTRLQTIPATSSKELLDVANTGMSIVNLIEKDKKAHADFDIKFATTILQKTNQLFDNPQDQILHQKYRSLANFDNSGKPSTLKKVCGIMLIFAGVLTIAVSALFIAASFGKSAPLSDIGIKIGVNAISQGVSIAAEITGIGLLLGGIGLFSNGMRKGLSKDMMKFDDTLNHANDKGQVIAKSSTVPALAGSR
jgi:hypothetical protein